jgi:hypothetical protein
VETSKDPQAQSTSCLTIVIERARQIAVGVFGAFLGLAVVKFGNPVILDHLVGTPETGLELVFSTWPCRWAFSLFFGTFAILGWTFLGITLWLFRAPLFRALRPDQFDRTTVVTVACLFGWYGWQWVALMDTVDTTLSAITVSQFSVCLICFLFGIAVVARLPNVRPLIWGLLVGLTITLWAGMDQKFGGLEATRRMIYEQGVEYPEEFLKRISTGRVFGTQFYPNSFAGIILLLSPLSLTFISNLTARFGNIAWGLAVGLLGYSSAACLYWSGSKSGWLIAAALVLLAVLRLPVAGRRKGLVVVIVVVVAAGAFGVRYASYFQRGATSVVARLDYWNAAIKVVRQDPLTGSGPGTFQVRYAVLKAPDSEMARLVHNDYLQQASDSGLPGLLFYTGLFLTAIWRARCHGLADPLRFSVWLGIVAWAAQNAVEFGLYIPASAWPAFTLTGWLVGNEVDMAERRK